MMMIYLFSNIFVNYIVAEAEAGIDPCLQDIRLRWPPCDIHLGSDVDQSRGSGSVSARQLRG